MSKLLLIDGFSILHRTFFGIPDLTNDKGLHTNAIYGFLNIMFRAIEDEKPDHLVVAFDVSAPTFRHEIFSEYKGTRKPMPDELREQVPVMKEVLAAMGIAMREKAGLEADDILGTFAKRAEKEGLEVTLLSGDRDLLQIASEHIKISIPKTFRGKTEIFNYYAKDVEAEYKVTPLQFIELKALMGDTSDNIPGVPKIGPKTAEELMAAYGSLDSIYEHVEEISKKSVKETLKANRELADLSKVLATINIDADIDTSLDAVKLGNIYTAEAYSLFQELSFRNMLSRFEAGETQDNKNDAIIDSIVDIANDKAFDEVLKEAILAKKAALSLKFESLSPNEESSGQMSLFDSVTDDKKVVIALEVNGKIFYADSSKVSVKKIEDGVRQLVRENVTIITHGVKKAYKLAGLNDEYATEVSKSFFDEEIAAYLLNPLKSEPDMIDIAKSYAGIFISDYGINFSKEKLSDILDAKREDIKKYMGIEAYAISKAYDELYAQLTSQGMISLMLDIEMPVSYVLYAMENEGMLVRREELKAYGQELLASIEKLEKKIYEQAGEEFNINSPKQLGELLFEKMGLHGGKKTKTGYSTSADVLEKLAEECPMVRDILEYRTLTKLRSTYAEGLSEYIGPDGRIHSSFKQTVTATGRISSADPNLQNIPTRMELGRLIRKVFVPREGCVLLDADYSQVELRILASFSGDEQLIDAYKNNKDIHALTASLVFGVPFDEVTDLQRRNAKAVNFGIVYGISSFGLSQDLSISRAEAKKYIEDYFETYPKIKEYLDNCKETAKEKGYSETYTGRRRPIPELKNSNFMQRQFGERVAMNAPIQGSAADVMKIAMINVYDRLKKEGLRSKLILQVHDELIIEAYADERELAARILEEEMVGAANFPVTLEVSSSYGDSWYEAK